ncbi:MAG: sn-glycerol-1-phosphate dehydrogenase [Clostridia bacterium]|nr:sn-glycerol-1-phosphate dehydrogenase [Clostridia bacterium]
MAVKVTYDSNDRMILEGLECSCPCDHSTPHQDIYIGRDLISRLPGYIAKRGLGAHCVVVCDENTYKVAGKNVHETLIAAGFDAILLKFQRDEELVPDQRTIGELLLTIQPETEFLVAVGSGSITDTCRVNAERCKMPFVSVGTAASMDGYTSVVAPLILNGVKIHRNGPCPEIILCDLDVLATAPIEMVRSGVGDVLGKYIAIADWEIGNIINDEPYCHTCGAIVLDAVKKLLDNVEEINNRTEKGMRVLIEGLILSGITIMIVGHTRAVASVEHNIGHYVEMRMLDRYGKAPSHGATVGASTLLVYPIFKKFAQADISGIDVASLTPIDPAARREFVLRAYGETAGNTIMEENPGDFLTKEELQRRAARAIERFDDIKAVIDGMPAYEKIYDAMQRLGAVMTLEGLGVDKDIINMAVNCAKDYRTRYTLFKTMDELGILDGYIADYPID